MTAHDNIKALALVCTLSPSSEKESSSQLLADQILTELRSRGAETTSIRIADYNIKHGVEIDMGNGDEWPGIREQIMRSDILLIATPIWVGHPSSIAQKVIERLDAELSETDDQGRLLTYGKVGIVGVVGNEDGAHKVSADLFQALSDVGLTIPAAGSAYWVGEAMNKTDYKDLKETPAVVKETVESLAINAHHLAKILKKESYPPTDKKSSQ